MPTANRKLQLGPLPKTEPIKLTVMCTAALKAKLDRYAEVHSQTYGDHVDACTLIPYMLDAFMNRDRAFRRTHPRSQLSSNPDGSATRPSATED